MTRRHRSTIVAGVAALLTACAPAAVLGAPRNLVADHARVTPGCPGFATSSSSPEGLSFQYGTPNGACSIGTPWGTPVAHGAQGRITFSAPGEQDRRVARDDVPRPGPGGRTRERRGLLQRRLGRVPGRQLVEHDLRLAESVVRAAASGRRPLRLLPDAKPRVLHPRSDQLPPARPEHRDGRPVGRGGADDRRGVRGRRGRVVACAAAHRAHDHRRQPRCRRHRAGTGPVGRRDPARRRLPEAGRQDVLDRRRRTRRRGARDLVGGRQRRCRRP